MSGAILGLDTATAATAAAVLVADGPAVEARDDPPPGSRGAHASRLLVLVAQAMEEAGVGWEDLDRLAVGVGPGGFTGLRIGVATARALGQARGLPLVPVSSLRALAAAAEASAGGAPGPVLAAIDARRGEVFAAAWAGGEALLAPAARGPAELAERLGSLPPGVRAVGDGALRYRAELEAAGARVAPGDSGLHRVSALAICRLGGGGLPVDPGRLLPDYLREPDAVAPGASSSRGP